MKNQSTQVAGGRWRLAGASMQVELLEAKLSEVEEVAFFLCVDNVRSFLWINWQFCGGGFDLICSPN